jgi:hypothetical protein
VNCNLINSNASTVIKLGMCTVKVLCQWKVKCYVFKVFIVECILSSKLKITKSPDICLYELFSLFR